MLLELRYGALAVLAFCDTNVDKYWHGMGKPSITEEARNRTGAEESWQIQIPENSAK